MSYILEALKKAEKDRQTGELPDIQTIHASVTQKGRTTTKNIVFVFLFVIICAIFISGYLMQLSNKESTNKLNDNISEQATIESETTKTSSGSENVSDSQKTESSVKIEEQLVVREPKPIILDNLGTQDQDTVLVDEINLPYRNELDESMRSKIPYCKYSGHTFSLQPKKRMIVINNKILREGESIAAGLTLEEIIWDGVILNYNGLMFRENLKAIK